MLISLAFAINASMVSSNMTEIFKDKVKLIGIFFIVVVGVIILRPIALKVLYKVFYEPTSRVESYRVEGEVIK